MSYHNSNTPLWSSNEVRAQQRPTTAMLPRMSFQTAVDMIIAYCDGRLVECALGHMLLPNAVTVPEFACLDCLNWCQIVAGQAVPAASPQVIAEGAAASESALMHVH